MNFFTSSLSTYSDRLLLPTNDRSSPGTCGAGKALCFCVVARRGGKYQSLSHCSIWSALLFASTGIRLHTAKYVVYPGLYGSYSHRQLMIFRLQQTLRHWTAKTYFIRNRYILKCSTSKLNSLMTERSNGANSLKMSQLKSHGTEVRGWCVFLCKQRLMDFG